MAEKTITRYQGVLIPTARFSSGTLVAKGAGSTDSAYTQAGPKTGVPAPSNVDGMVVQASGTQSGDGSLELYAQQGGLSGDGRSGYVWRDLAAGDSATEYMGQDAPNLITGLAFPWYTTSSSLYYNPRPQPVALQSGVILSVLTQVKSSGAIKFGFYTPSTSAWTDANLTPERIKDTSGTVVEQHGPAVVQLNAEGVSGRVVALIGSTSNDNVDAYVSGDDGATWAACGFNVLNTRLPYADIREMAAAVDEVSGEIVLFVAYRDGSSNRNMSQYVSHDHGASFEAVQTDFRTALTQDPEQPAVVALSGGGFVFGYVNNDASTAYPLGGRLLNASDDATSITLTNMASVPSSSATLTEQGLALVRDSGGRVLAYLSNRGGQPGNAVAFSEDSGATWALTNPLWATTASSSTGGGYLHGFGAAQSEGLTVLVSRWTSSGDTHDTSSALALYIGGHSRHTGPSGVAPGSGDIETYTFGSSIGWDRTRGIDGGAYLPIGDPASMGWAASGTGSEALVVPGALEVTTTAGQTRIYSRSWTSAGGSDGPLGNGPEAAFYEIAVDLDAADGDNTTDEIGVRLRFSDSNATTANFVYDLSLRLDSGGYRLWDVAAGASVVANEQAQVLTVHTRIRVAIDKAGGVKTWYCVPGHGRAWAEGIGGTLTDDSGTNPTNTNLVEWGHRSAGAHDTRWHFAGYTGCALRWSPITDDGIGTTWTNPDDLRHRLFSAQFDSLTDGVSVRALGGAACRGDTWQIDAEYGYPVGNAFVPDEPSPGRKWRSVDTSADVVFVFDLESIAFTANSHTSYLTSPAFGLAFFGANFRTAYVEGYNGSTWDTLGTADASEGFTGMVYARNGSQVRAGSGTFTADNYLFRNVHAGDTFDLGDGASAKRYRKITSNSEGTWTSETAKKPVVRLAGMLGDEAASGTGAIWCRDFGVIIHDHDQTYELYRVRIPSQDTADGYFQAKVVVGPVAAFGHDYDLGWSVRRERAYSDISLRNGRRRRAPEGPVRRVLDVAWALGGVDASEVYRTQGTGAGETIPDYIAGHNDPLAGIHDTISQVESIVEEVEGLPVVLLRRVETGSDTVKITRREQMVLGRIVTDPQRNNVLGDEVHTPLDRLNTIRFEEEV